MSSSLVLPVCARGPHGSSDSFTTTKKKTTQLQVWNCQNLFSDTYHVQSSSAMYFSLFMSLEYNNSVKVTLMEVFAESF